MAEVGLVKVVGCLSFLLRVGEKKVNATNLTFGSRFGEKEEEQLSQEEGS